MSIKKIDILDLSKIVLALMIVAIHSELFPMVLYPWLRLAVPMFFIISSYLLNYKIYISPQQNKNDIIKHYINRLLKLYMFWFVVLLPITIYVRRAWFSDGLLIGIINLIFKPFVGSTFIASWYLTASIIGTLIVEKLTAKFNYKVLIPLFIFIYLVCCCTSSYSFLFKNIKILKSISPYIVIEPHCSFLVSLIYIYIGKMMVYKAFAINKKINIVLLIISCILLYAEWYILYKIQGIFDKDCYIFIMPSVLLLFNYIKDINVVIKKSKVLRQFSNFIYPLHASVIPIVNYILSCFIYNKSILSMVCFIVTIIISIILYIVVRKMENKFKILKYSY